MINSKLELVEYCYRALGHPVIEINIDDDQIDDRIDEALSKFYEYHYDSTEKLYYIHTVDQATIDNRSFTVPSSVMTVNKLIESGLSGFTSPLGDSYSSMYDSSLNGALFGGSVNSATTHKTANVGGSQETFDTVSFFVRQQAIANFKEYFIAKFRFDFSRHKNEVKFYKSLNVGDVIVAECLSEIDPETYTSIYNDYWLKTYCIQLIKRQWGANLKKYSGVQLVGGVTLNGQQIYDEAIEEIEKLDKRF